MTGMKFWFMALSSRASMVTVNRTAGYLLPMTSRTRNSSAFFMEGSLVSSSFQRKSPSLTVPAYRPSRVMTGMAV